MNLAHLSIDSSITLKENLPNTQVCNKLANLYSLFSDSTRLKIIVSLLLEEMCVGDLATLLNTNQTTISHQLKLLKNAGAVTSTRRNKFIFYKVNNRLISQMLINGVDFIIGK